MLLTRTLITTINASERCTIPKVQRFFVPRIKEILLLFIANDILERIECLAQGIRPDFLAPAVRQRQEERANKQNLAERVGALSSPSPSLSAANPALRVQFPVPQPQNRVSLVSARKNRIVKSGSHYVYHPKR